MPDSNLVSPYVIAKTFGIHPQRLRTWLKNKLPSQPAPGKSSEYRLIDLEDLKKWTAANPSTVHGVSISQLSKLIDDPELVRAIVSKSRRPLGRPRQVVQLAPEQRQFKTMREAAKACFLNYEGLSRALSIARKRQQKCVDFCGLIFLVDEDDAV